MMSYIMVLGLHIIQALTNKFYFVCCLPYNEIWLDLNFSLGWINE